MAKCTCTSMLMGEGSPEGVVAARPKTFYFDNDDTPALWYKRKGFGKTGWFQILG